MSRLTLIILDHLIAALEGIREEAQRMSAEDGHIRVDEQFYREVEEYAPTRNRSVDNLVEHAVRQYMSRYPKSRIGHQEGGENGK